MPLAAVAGISAGTSLLGGIFGSNAAKDAADAQASAAEQAAQLQYQASQNALDYQKQKDAQNQSNIAPWLQMGGGALNQLGYLLGISPNTSLGGQGATSLPYGGGSTYGSPTALSGPIPTAPAPTGTAIVPRSPFAGTQPIPMAGVSNVRPVVGSGVTSGPTSITGGTSALTPASPTTPGAGTPPAAGGFGSLLQPYSGTFTAPTDITEQNDPGYQARLKLGTDALQRSAAARGGVLTGGTAQALDQFGQDYASNEYNSVYNRALQNFGTNYDVYNQNQANQFNRLAALAGVGQTAANQLGSLGQSAANGVTSNLLSTAANMGQDYQNAGAANASGYVGGANAYSGALSGIGGNISNLYLMQQLMGGGGGGYVPSGNELTDMGI